MNQTDMMAQIAECVGSGNDVIVCWPRRGGKTELTAILIKALTKQGKKIAVYTDHTAHRAEIKSRISNTDKPLFFGKMSTNRLRGRDIDVVFADEMSYMTDEIFDRIEVAGCQIVFFMTPMPYGPDDVPFCKKLWDSYPAIKFQMTPSVSMSETYRKTNKDDWRPEHYQTEVEGNWVCADGW